MNLAFPRVVNGEGYFYPRQEFKPEFLTKERTSFNQNSIRMNNRRAINPFNNQNYFYPAPYLQLPTNGKTYAFKSNYPSVYSPMNDLQEDYKTINTNEESDGSIKLGTIIVLPKESAIHSEREPKAANSTKKLVTERKSEKAKDKQEQNESSLIENIVNYVPDALGFSDEDEDEPQDEVAPALKVTAIKNDKYLNLAIKKHPQEIEDEEENRKLPPPLHGANIRAFNFSNPLEKLQNITKKFSIVQREETTNETTERPKTPSEENDEQDEDDKLDEKEDGKSPFGQILSFGPKQQLQTFKEGGLIIQRLRVRQGGIAIAGPGGVATVIASRYLY